MELQTTALVDQNWHGECNPNALMVREYAVIKSSLPFDLHILIRIILSDALMLTDFKIPMTLLPFFPDHQGHITS